MPRPDLADAVRPVARYCENPEQKTLEGGHRDTGIRAGATGHGDYIRREQWSKWILAYVDADHATGLNVKRSVSGGVIVLASAALYCFSRMQRITALSSTESKYMAVNEALKEVKFLRQVQASVHETEMELYCVNVMEDNEGAIESANSPISSHRTKHTDVRHHFIRHHGMDRRRISRSSTSEQKTNIQTS